MLYYLIKKIEMLYYIFALIDNFLENLTNYDVVNVVRLLKNGKTFLQLNIHNDSVSNICLVLFIDLKFF